MNPFNSKDSLQETVEGVLSEALDKPYKYKFVYWGQQEIRASAKTDDGRDIDVGFHEVPMTGFKRPENRPKGVPWIPPKQWEVSFAVDGSDAQSGRGNAQRIFATVIAIVDEFLKNKKPRRFFFGAEKSGDMKSDETTTSREKLYIAMTKRYASMLKSKYGYSFKIIPRSKDREFKVLFER